jgi:signal transduction histidine kinase
LKALTKLIDTVKMLSFTSGIMRNLMMDLLDLAQMEKNTFKLNKDYFNLFEVIDQAFKMVSHVSEKKNVHLMVTHLELKEA